MIPLLSGGTPFPPVDRALYRPNGLLAAGGDLSPGRLLDAYRHGIFPWFNAGEPILWWSPDPRMVLFPPEFKISRSLRRTLRNRPYEVRADADFERVMRACAAPRTGQRRSWNAAAGNDGARDSRGTALSAPEDAAPSPQDGTWIHDDMVSAYTALHRQGHAHSIETWIDGELCGGLYGVSIGRMFYGESMFSLHSDASKIALAHLALQLVRWNFGMIDCQMNTRHLASLGAREIPRAEFVSRLRELINYPDLASPWKLDHDLVE